MVRRLNGLSDGLFGHGRIYVYGFLVDINVNFGLRVFRLNDFGDGVGTSFADNGRNLEMIFHKQLFGSSICKYSLPSSIGGWPPSHLCL